MAVRTWTVAIKALLLVLGGTWTFESGVVGSITGTGAVVDTGSASDAAISPLSPRVPHAVDCNTHLQYQAAVRHITSRLATTVIYGEMVISWSGGKSKVKNKGHTAESS